MWDDLLKVKVSVRKQRKRELSDCAAEGDVLWLSAVRKRKKKKGNRDSENHWLGAPNKVPCISIQTTKWNHKDTSDSLGAAIT